MPITVIPAPEGTSFADAFAQAYQAGLARNLEMRKFKAAQEQAAKTHALAVQDTLSGLYASDPELTAQALTNPAIRKNLANSGVDIDSFAPVDVNSETGALTLRSGGLFRQQTTAEKTAARAAEAGAQQAEEGAKQARTKTQRDAFEFGTNMHETVREFTASNKNRPYYDGKPMRPAEVMRMLTFTAREGDPTEGARKAGFDPDKITYSPERLSEAQDWANTLQSLGYSAEETDKIMRNMVVTFPYDLARLGVENAALLGDMYRASRDAAIANTAAARKKLEEEKGLTPYQKVQTQQDFQADRNLIYGNLMRLGSMKGYAVDENGYLKTKAPGWIARGKAWLGLGPVMGEPYEVTRGPEADKAEHKQVTFNANQIAALVDPFSMAGQNWLAKHGITLPTVVDDPEHLKATLTAVGAELGISLVHPKSSMMYVKEVTDAGKPVFDTLDNPQDIITWFTQKRASLSNGRMSAYPVSPTDEQKALLQEGGYFGGSPSMGPRRRFDPTNPEFELEAEPVGPAPTPAERPQTGILPSSATPGLPPDVQRALSSIEAVTNTVRQQAEEMKKAEEELRKSRELTRPPGGP